MVLHYGLMAARIHGTLIGVTCPCSCTCLVGANEKPVHEPQGQQLADPLGASELSATPKPSPKVCTKKWLNKIEGGIALHQLLNQQEQESE
jgi:hypothetical protein